MTTIANIGGRENERRVDCILTWSLGEVGGGRPLSPLGEKKLALLPALNDVDNVRKFFNNFFKLEILRIHKKPLTTCLDSTCNFLTTRKS